MVVIVVAGKGLHHICHKGQGTFIAKVKREDLRSLCKHKLRLQQRLLEQYLIAERAQEHILGLNVCRVELDLVMQAEAEENEEGQGNCVERAVAQS